MEITQKQIRENILDKARARCEFINSSTTEEECQRIELELSTDNRKLAEFMKTCFALGFLCHLAGDSQDDDAGTKGKEHFMAAMTGAAVLAETVRFSNEMKAKN